MDQSRNQPLTVGQNVRFKDGRQGRITRTDAGNRITVETEEGETIEAPAGEAEVVDTSNEGADPPAA